MAIDNRTKRASALTYEEPWCFEIGPPNASISSEKKQVLGLYSGISIAFPSGINDRNRRASALQLEEPWQFEPPLPDGTISRADRAHLSGLYAPYLYGGVTSFINTRDKRSSALQFEVPWQFEPFLPDGNIVNKPDRAHLLQLYRGIPIANQVFSFINTRARRAAALVFEEPWCWESQLPDNDINNKPDKQQLLNSYPGIPWQVVTPAYNGSGTLIARIQAAGAGGQNMNIAGNSGSFPLVLAQIFGDGSFTAASNPTGSGSASVPIVLSGVGGYVGDVFGDTSLIVVEQVLVTGAGTFAAFTGTSHGNGVQVAQVQALGVGSFAPNPGAATDIVNAIFQYFMTGTQHTFEDTITTIYRNPATGTVSANLVSAGGRGLYFEAESLQKLLDEIKAYYAKKPPTKIIERVIEKQPIIIEAPPPASDGNIRYLTPVVMPGADQSEEAIARLIAEMLNQPDDGT